MWSRFAKYHYLNYAINAGARIFVAERHGELLALCGVQQLAGQKGMKQFTRTIVLPDYQGIGIMTHLTTEVGRMIHAEGFQVVRITANPAIVHALKNHPHWVLKSIGRRAATRRVPGGTWAVNRESKQKTDSCGRVTFSYRYRE